MDDMEIGRRFRAIRVHKGWRQLDLARSAGTSRACVSRIEHGRLDELTLGLVRRVAHAFDMRLELVARWRGGDLDRMVNARHAALHETAALRFAALVGWTTAAEVSFNVYGERGTVDVLAWHAGRKALLVVELKTEIVDVQGLLGAVDRTGASRRGWHESVVGSPRRSRRGSPWRRVALTSAPWPGTGRCSAGHSRPTAGGSGPGFASPTGDWTR